MKEIQKGIAISKERVYHISRKELATRKFTARWVLTLDQKLVRKNIYNDLLERFKWNEKEFLCRFIIVGESWTNHYTTETKQQPRQWIVKDEPAAKKAKTF